MKKILLASFILLVMTGFSLFSVELYGYVGSVQASNYEQQKIVLDSSQPVIGIISGAPVLQKDIRTLLLDTYSSSVFSALLQARANNWCVKFIIGEYIDNGIISSVEIPCSMMPEDNLIAEYLFNGNTKDTSGYSNHLENYYNTRIVNGFVLFDGDDDGLGLEYLNNFSKKALTIAVWIKAKMGEGCTRVVEIGEYYDDSTAIVIDSDSAGTLKGFRYWVHTDTENIRIESSAGTDYDYHDNLWHHIILTYDSTEEIMKFYIDGIEAGSKIATGYINSNLELNIGNLDAVDEGTDHTFSGYMDNIRIYRRALTAEEISMYYIAEKLNHP